MCILIAKAFLYVVEKCNIMLTWKYIIVLNKKTNFKHVYYIHNVEIPTQKGEDS